MLASSTHHVGPSADVRASRAAPFDGPGATSPSPVEERGSFFSRDRLRLQAADHACVVLRTSIHLLHLRRSPAAPKESMGFFADVQNVFAGVANA